MYSNLFKGLTLEEVQGKLIECCEGKSQEAKKKIEYTANQIKKAQVCLETVDLFLSGIIVEDATFCKVFNESLEKKFPRRTK